MMQPVVRPVVQLVGQPVASCKRGITVSFCIKETLNVCAWGTKYPHVQIFSTIIGRGLLPESHLLVQHTTIQAESNELFGIIITCVFVEMFRKFLRRCFRCFPLDLQLQRLREGRRHLLVINLMRAVRSGSCDSTAMLVTMAISATVDIPGVADASLAENLSSQCVNQRCKTARHPTHRRHRRH